MEICVWNYPTIMLPPTEWKLRGHGKVRISLICLMCMQSVTYEAAGCWIECVRQHAALRENPWAGRNWNGVGQVKSPATAVKHSCNLFPKKGFTTVCTKVSGVTATKSSFLMAVLLSSSSSSSPLSTFPLHSLCREPEHGYNHFWRTSHTSLKA